MKDYFENESQNLRKLSVSHEKNLLLRIIDKILICFISKDCQRKAMELSEYEKTIHLTVQ